MKLVEVLEDNTEFNECSYQILLLGLSVYRYSGPRAGALDQLNRRAKQIEEDALAALAQLGFERKS